MKDYRKLSAELWQSLQYRQIVDVVAELRPVVPQFDYKTGGNIEELKFKLAQQQMHDTVMSVLKPNTGES